MQAGRIRLVFILKQFFCKSVPTLDTWSCIAFLELQLCQVRDGNENALGTESLYSWNYQNLRNCFVVQQNTNICLQQRNKHSFPLQL